MTDRLVRVFAYQMATSKRAQKREARPAEVLEAALETFVAKGFAAARMEDIALRAGVSKGTVYLYFPSKQAVFEALVRENLVPTLERAEVMMARAQGPAAARLRALLGFAEEIVEDPRRVAIPKLVLAEAGNFPELARFYREEVIERVLGILCGILEHGMRRGEFRELDAPIAARLFMAPILMAALWQTTFAPYETTGVPPSEILALHAELFLRSIAAEPAAEGPS